MPIMSIRRRRKIAVFALIMGLMLFDLPLTYRPVAQADDGSSTTLPNGVAAGDVTQNSVVLWARSTVPGDLIFTTPGGGRATQRIFDTAIPGKIVITGLAPGTDYTYSVQNAAGDSASGRFRTPATVGERVGLRFGVTGDWRGDLAPYVALSNAPQRNLDFFVGLGDTIYADIPSPAVPGREARSLADYRRKHDEVYSLHQGANVLGDLRASTAMFATIDDHEVVNDFAGGSPVETDGRFGETSGRVNDTQRFEAGLQAFVEYNPIRVEMYGQVDDDGRAGGEQKLYRYRTFGSDAAIFLLDARSFRDAPIDGPATVDDWEQFLSETYRADRTMLGQVQLAELKRDLLDAQAKGITWKFVIGPEPIQNMGPISMADRFEGYAAERTELLNFIRTNQLANVVFIAADIHGTIVNNLAYRDEANGPAVLVDAFEVTAGPAAFFIPFGPAAADIARAWGWISPADYATYQALPVAPDGDSRPDDKDDFVKKTLDDALDWFDDDPIGLVGSSIDAALLSGDYIAVHTYGWTEFEIKAESQQLIVTTYGVHAYSGSDLTHDPAAVLDLAPQIVSQFRVNPRANFTHRMFLPLASER